MRYHKQLTFRCIKRSTAKYERKQVQCLALIRSSDKLIQTADEFQIPTRIRCAAVFYQAAVAARTRSAEAARIRSAKTLHQAEFVMASKFVFYQAAEAARIRSAKAIRLTADAGRVLNAKALRRSEHHTIRQAEFATASKFVFNQAVEAARIRSAETLRQAVPMTTSKFVSYQAAEAA